MPHDIKAMKKWNEIPEHFRKKVLENVHCSKCGSKYGVTTVVDYEINDLQGDIYLIGKCKRCGGKVARLLDGE